MYRILVIDDEPIIADGLYELFAQDETFALEVHKVYSAPDALKLLDRRNRSIIPRTGKEKSLENGARKV